MKLAQREREREKERERGGGCGGGGVREEISFTSQLLRVYHIVKSGSSEVLEVLEFFHVVLKSSHQLKIIKKQISRPHAL